MIEQMLVCDCGSTEFSILEQRNTDIALGSGTISMVLDVKCDVCGEITRENIEALITDIR